MKFQHSISIVAMIATLGGGCSSRPRNFVATLQSPASNALGYQQDFETCRALARQGHRSGFKAAALSGGLGAASGVGAAAVAAPIGMAGGTAAAAATFAIPIIGIGIGFGVSRAIRSGKEKKLKFAMANCLSEYGYVVDTWTLEKRAKRAAVRAAQARSETSQHAEIVQR